MAANISIFIPHTGCPQMCSFCNQHKISGEDRPPSPQQAADSIKAALAVLNTEAEIAFFGGSFTAVDTGYMCALLEAAQPFLSDERIKGIRISTRPDAIDVEILSILKYYSVTAIELGAQSMDDSVLDLNRRGHTAKSVEDAAKLIKDFGFSLGLQMMTGLYGSSYEKDIYTGERLATLLPDTVRIYPTVVLPDTELAEFFYAGKYFPPTVEETLPILLKLRKIFSKNNIKIIRMGLHASKEVEKSMIAGCYHAALGELCMGEEFFIEIVETLKGFSQKNIELNIQPSKLSVVLGHKKRNLERLYKMGYNVNIVKNKNITKPYVLSVV